METALKMIFKRSGCLQFPEAVVTHSLFPIGSSYGKGSPENIITDDAQIVMVKKNMARCKLLSMCFSLSTEYVEMVT